MALAATGMWLGAASVQGAGVQLVQWGFVQDAWPEARPGISQTWAAAGLLGPGWFPLWCILGRAMSSSARPLVPPGVPLPSWASAAPAPVPRTVLTILKPLLLEAGHCSCYW